MDVDRRGFLFAVGAMALAPFSLKAVRWRSAATASAHLFRPDPIGASASICPRCGTPEHTALDPSCPIGAEPRSAVQAAARAKGGITGALEV
jgi:hypothetical protein